MTKPVILICEDEADSREAISRFLGKRDYQVYSASDGLKALRLANKLKPRLILLDIRMPKLDGIEVARKIRASGIKAKIIFITAFQGQELTKEAVKYDIFDYIVKPVSCPQLLASIERALAG